MIRLNLLSALICLGLVGIADPCDPDIISQMDRYYRLYQDDSLTWISRQALSETSTPNTICDFYYSFYLFNSYLYNDFEKASEVLESMGKSSDPQKEVLRILSLQAYHNKQNAYLKRLEVLHEGNAIISRVSDSAFRQKWTPSIIRSIADTYNRLSIFDSALYFANQLAQFNQPLLSLNMHMTKSRIFREMGEIDRSFEELLKGNQFVNDSLVSARPRFICNYYNNVGAGYIELNRFDSALYYLEKSLALARILKNRRLIETRIQNIALIYLEQRDLVKARKSFLESLKILNSTEGERNSYKLSVVYENLSALELEAKNYDLALSYAEESFKNANEAGRKSLIVDASFLMSTVLEEMGRMTESYKYFKIYAQEKENLLGEEKIRVIEELNTKYETEKKEQAIASLSQENEIKDLKIDQQHILIISIASISLLSIGLGYCGYKQKQLLSEQKQLALEQGLLRAQMNPHFIFNALNSIQNFITSNQGNDATLYLAKFGELTRDILEASGENWIPLEKELGIIRNYLDLERVRFQKKLQFKYQIEVEDEGYLLVPPMLIQPFLENAVKHGFKGKDEGEISLTLKESNERIHVTIKDNGVGLIQNEKHHESKAIEITNQRLKNISAKKSNQVMVSNDKDGGILKGVIVKFDFPVKYEI